MLIAEATDGGQDYSALAQLFGLNQLPRAPALIAPGILGSQLLADSGVELFLTSVLRIPLLARTALGFEPLRKLFAAGPSLREMGLFFHLLTFLRAELPGGAGKAHEVILIDMPATGHALALTGLPQVLLRLIPRGPIVEALREGQAYLHDPRLGGAFVVTLPETLPISEALELIEGLEKTEVQPAGLFINRVPQDPFTAAEREALGVFLAGTPVYGAQKFRQILEARRSIERLRASTAVPTLTVPEIDKQGAELVTALVEALEGQRFSPAAPLAGGAR